MFSLKIILRTSMIFIYTHKSSVRVRRFNSWQSGINSRESGFEGVLKSCPIRSCGCMGHRNSADFDCSLFLFPSRTGSSQ